MLLTPAQLDELSVLWIFRDGGYEKAPSERELSRTVKLIGCKYPDEDDKRAARDRARRAYHSAPVRSAPAPVQTASEAPRRAIVPAGAEEWEAKIKVMGWPEAKELLARNGLSIIEEAPNPGIRTMRARNALYAALRRGVVLK